MGWELGDRREEMGDRWGEVRRWEIEGVGLGDKR